MIEQIIKEEFKLRVIDEGLVRINKCATYLTDEELWKQPTSKTNSVGNLILHLEGNVRQYILSGVGGHEDLRKRIMEFDNTNRMTRKNLLSHLETTVRRANDIVFDLNKKDFIREEVVQGFDMTVLSCIIHAIEHFSYHVGQITFYTKLLKDVDTGYYQGLDLNINKD